MTLHVKILPIAATLALLAPAVAAAAPGGEAAPAVTHASAPPVAGQGAPLVAHKVNYDLTLASSFGAKAPTAINGRISFDFTGDACDGYSQTFRQFTELQSDEGPARVSDMSAVTYEDPAGRTFRFKLETRQNGAPAEQVDGRATRSDDGALSVALERPKRAAFDVAKDVMFPTAHMLRVLDSARAGRPMFEAKVFDGTDSGEKVYDTLTVIGKPIVGVPAEKAAQTPELAALRRWPVAISYFEEGKKDSAPHYVLSFDLYENGVSRALKLDYGEFVLKGEMTKLEFLPVKACTK